MAATGTGRFFEGLSARFRAGRDVALRAFLSRLSAANGGALRVLDLGGRVDYWARVGFDFLDAHDIHIHCINYTTDELRLNVGQHPRITAEVGDARNLPHLADGSFDLVHSNSVIEHVGRFADMLAFAGETRRLAPAYYLQTPYFWFPIDPHSPRAPFIHWLPNPLRLKIVRRVKVGWARPTRDVAHSMRNIESTMLIDKSMLRALLPDARIRFERLLLLPKSLIAERG
ncbi:class I SAM-dependent methyltransferase [Sandaracinobacteroides saxicola]|uniref:Class I SAM-dependent methyltransferase n=1 Tax=Sandaracinobacteroides saxicola TaxID=2759707 RepID=A0A7G5IIK6_9SPHN|nr:class I SAM-dependent methyltransferase [Sandaracinobacteroides saxicola]QMW23198.1 class I SAM-dependent methyltransferase [Sandaracinobacteroides saxicola]